MKIIALIIAFCYVHAIALAQTLTDSIGINPDVKIGKLSNGISYYLRNVPNEKMTGIYFVVKAGSYQDDSDQKGGVAHTIEHLGADILFPPKGAYNFALENGLQPGIDVGASTNGPYTEYRCYVPKENQKLQDSVLHLIKKNGARFFI